MLLIKFSIFITAPPSPLIGSDGEHSQHSMSLPGQVSLILNWRTVKLKYNRKATFQRLGTPDLKIIVASECVVT